MLLGRHELKRERTITGECKRNQFYRDKKGEKAFVNVFEDV